ncbi:hypothetical protein JVU11DRAFT_2569 [Chiua virens]|nr:hypothetical protein JVU11DRAFT_2569 [Chiua virens]
MTTWAQHIRHPWLAPSTMKRRLLVDDVDVDGTPLSYDMLPRRKRVRYGSLERTLAHMSIDTSFAVPSEDVDMRPRVSLPPPRLYDSLSSDVILPSSVEEPTTPSESVEMEVEPTVVSTNTFAAAAPSPPDWKSIESGQPDIKEIEISPAVLECIRRQIQHPAPLIPLPSQSLDSQALVLYRAVQPPVLEQPKSIQVAQEDDIMEVE